MKETFHASLQIKIASGALAQFKTGSLGLVEMDEEHTEMSRQREGMRGDLRPRAQLGQPSQACCKLRFSCALPGKHLARTERHDSLLDRLYNLKL